MLAPAARNTDPDSSHLAEKEITTSGKRAVQMMRVVEIVKRYPGHTSKELSAVTGIDRYEIARRLPDAESVNLVEKGEPRTCGISGRKACIWHPVVNRNG